MTCINTLKVLRTDIQREALRYIVLKTKNNNSHKFTAPEIANELGITLQGARKLLLRFAQLGFLNPPTKKRFNIPPALQRTGKKGFKWTHWDVLNFTIVIDVIRSFFFKKVKPDCFTTNNNLNNNNTLSLGENGTPATSLEVEFKIQQSRKDYKKKYAPVLIEKCKSIGLTAIQIKEKMIEFFGSGDEETKSTTILAFMTEPKLEELDFELDKVEEIIDDLESKRDEWSTKQTRFWFGLKDKQRKLFKTLRSFMQPIFEI